MHIQLDNNKQNLSARFLKRFYVKNLFMLRLHSLCILQGGGGGGGQRILWGVLKFSEQKKGGYENCLNISWGDAYFL